MTHCHSGSPRGVTTRFSQTPGLREGTGMLRRFCSLLLNNHSLLPGENAKRMKQWRPKRGLRCVGSWLWHLLFQRGESALSLLEVAADRSRTYLLRRGASALQKPLIQKHKILHLLMNSYYVLPHIIYLCHRFLTVRLLKIKLHCVVRPDFCLNVALQKEFFHTTIKTINKTQFRGIYQFRSMINT